MNDLKHISLGENKGKYTMTWQLIKQLNIDGTDFDVSHDDVSIYLQSDSGILCLEFGYKDLKDEARDTALREAGLGFEQWMVQEYIDRNKEEFVRHKFKEFQPIEQEL